MPGTVQPQYGFGDNSPRLGYPVNYNTYQGGQNVGYGFTFKKRFERVDWRKIASVDLERISRDLDFQTLQDNITNITFCNIETELDLRNIDPNFIKLFKMGQLTIEYLLHSQDYLTGALGGMEENLQKTLEEHELTKAELEKQRKELAEVKKECHKRKKLLMAQQQILQAGPDSYHMCPYCQKGFLNNSFLLSHLRRRHQEHFGSMQPQQPVGHSSNGSSPNLAIETELREIKERLQLTESQLEEERSQLKLLMSQKSTTTRSEVTKEHHVEIEEWKVQQESEHRKEMENVRNMFMKELKEMHEKYKTSETALVELQHKSAKKSNLGVLVDDVDGDRDSIALQREEVARLKEQLKDQINSMENSVRGRFDEHEKRLKSRMQNMAKQHATELQRLGNALEASSKALMEEKAKKGEKAEIDEQIQDLLQSSKEQEELIHQQELRIDELAQRQVSRVTMETEPSPSPPATETPIQQPPVIEKSAASAVEASSPPKPISPRRAPPKKKKKEVIDVPEIVEQPPSSLGDTEDEEESEIREEYTALRDLNLEATGGFSSLGRSAEFSLSQDLVGTLVRSSRLQQHMQRDPNILKGMKEELLELLKDQLEERGIPADATGITNVVLNNKLDLLKKERVGLNKKYRNFNEIRYQYERKVDAIAQERMDASKKSPKPAKSPRSPRKKSPDMPRRSPRSPRKSPAVARKSPNVIKRNLPELSSAKRTPEPSRRSPELRSPDIAPRPAPRNSNNTLSTSYSYTASSAQSESQWTDDDSEEEHMKLLDAAIEATQPDAMMKPAGSSGTWPRTKAKSPVLLPKPVKSDNEESEWDSEDISDLRDLAPKRSGSNVASLTKSIEKQLNTRGNTKPTGGVDIGTNGYKNTKIENLDDDDDDSLSLSVSSLDQPKPIPRVRTASTGKGGETELSNTYGTSVWGSTSKGNPKSSISVTDWESDLDLDDLQ